MRGDDDLPGARANRWILIPSAALTTVLLLGGILLALAPYLVFHSMDGYRYSWYHTSGPIIGLVSLIPANVWVGSVVGPRAVAALRGRRRGTRIVLVVSAMLVGTVIAAALVYLAFAVIYLSTVNWFVF